MLKISRELLSKVITQAQQNVRKRQHHNFHKNYDEPVQRLINACGPDSYFRPHRHIDSGKLEILLVLKGSFVVVFFDDAGNILDHTFLNNTNGDFGVEIQPEDWHSIIVLEEDTVIYEIKEGPFDENKSKIFADWSPTDDSKEAKLFIKETLANINFPIPKWLT